MNKTHKVPLRKCIVTQERLEKKDLFRVVINKDKEVFVDTTGRAHGRGIYIKKDEKTIKKAKQKNLLSKQLRTEVDPSIYDTMLGLLDE